MTWLRQPGSVVFVASDSTFAMHLLQTTDVAAAFAMIQKRLADFAQN